MPDNFTFQNIPTSDIEEDVAEQQNVSDETLKLQYSLSGLDTLGYTFAHNCALVGMPINNSEISHINKYGNTPLHIAAQQGHWGLVFALCETQKIDVNCVNVWGLTPLHYAAMEGHMKVIQVLCKYGARTDIEDSAGKTARQRAKVAQVKHAFPKGDNSDCVVA